MIGIYEAWKAGDYEKARELQFSILLAVRAMFSLPFPLGFKVAMEMRGFTMGPPKQPLSDAERFKYRTMKARIEKIMQSILERLKKTSRSSRSEVS
jgi:dihydrodipicolinate synthase/N-acetylneuraminate lyase